MYIGVKLGSNPKYKKLVMLAAEDEIALEGYVKSIGGAFRAAPESVDKNLAGCCGLLLLTNEAMIRAEDSSSPYHTTMSVDNSGSPISPTTSSFRRGEVDIEGEHSDDDEDDSKIVKKGFSGTTAKKKK